MRRSPVTAVLLLLALAGAPRAHAAEVTIEVSSRETWVGIPFLVRVTVTDGSPSTDPTLPAVDGLDVLGPAQRAAQSFTTIVNGRMRRKQNVTYTWTVAPARAGQFRIPPVEVDVDGEVYRSRPIEISAEDSVAGDDVVLEVVADREEYYLGERVPLRLDVWLRQFEDPDTRRALNAQTMMSCIQARSSRWGVFAEDLESVDVRDDVRMTADGVEADYTVVSLEGSVVPQVPGPLTIDDVRVLVDYPESIVARRPSILSGRRYEIGRSRAIAVAPAPTSIEIRPLPEIGRPPTFTGAVGRYDVAVSALPRDVVVGDPIELTITVTDLTGEGRLDGLAPPALHLDPVLTTGFRVPNEAVPGTVNGRRKVFSQKIRATSDAVAEIPPIAFAYFDPAQGSYGVAMSDAVPITVSPAVEVSLSEVVTAANPGTAPDATIGTTLTAVSGGIIAAYDDVDALLATSATSIGSGFWVAVALPPFAWMLVTLVRIRARRRREDPASVRRRQARGHAMRRLADDQAAAAVAGAVRGYIADRLGLPEGAVTAVEAAARLRAAGVNGACLESVETLLADCDRAVYAGGETTSSLGERARACIAELERERLR